LRVSDKCRGDAGRRDRTGAAAGGFLAKGERCGNERRGFGNGREGAAPCRFAAPPALLYGHCTIRAHGAISKKKARNIILML